MKASRQMTWRLKAAWKVSLPANENYLARFREISATEVH
jgi:hypothetical protein